MKNKLLRTFVAITAPSEVGNIKQMLLSTMENDKADIRWVKHSSLHLTVKFLGYTPEGDIISLCSDIDNLVKKHHPFNLSVSGTGCFPNTLKPSVLYLDVSGDHKPLSLIVNEAEELFSNRGYPKMKDTVIPHITLARIKYPQKFTPDVTSFLNSSYDGIDFPVNHLQFFSSEILPEGVFYIYWVLFHLPIYN